LDINFKTLLNNTLFELPSDWEVFYAGYFVPANIKKISENIFKLKFGTAQAGIRTRVGPGSTTSAFQRIIQVPQWNFMNTSQERGNIYSDGLRVTGNSQTQAAGESTEPSCGRPGLPSPSPTLAYSQP
jgi:hypothetical protein